MSSSAAASMTDELEATRQKKRRKKHRERAEVAAASSESPRPPATPYSMLESPAPTAPETLTSTAVAAASPLVEEAVRKEERKKHKRSRYQDEAATPSPSAPATAAQILEMAAARKEQRRGKVEQGQSCQALLPVDVHPQGGGAAAAAYAGVSVSQSVKRCRGGKIPVLSDREILRIRRIELRKQQPMPESFTPAMANSNPIDQDSKYSSPFGAFFDQFCYKPDRQEGRNATSLPNTPDRPARPLPRDHLPSLSSQLTANETFMAAKTTTSNTKQPRSASVSRPQEEVKLNEKKWSEKIISQMKKLRKKSPLLSAAEKRSNKYRRLPLNQLVCPPRSRYNLLQEKYASDPWKVIVIC
ncbi:serine/arginine repetitive matrix protein 1-like isoform X3 [Panicum miliaceum]|uniref:Serine/arginine repetitive matrix protein 1-like isoform X3 n=1 Tax=Panicum miliaceum TaxID=4540 RepID=A0A3L6PYW9_PANMI|nr:serine/arginine repetitive matrix protein 1-like isoform X3 [Panicum miliaceum]